MKDSKKELENHKTVFHRRVALKCAQNEKFSFQQTVSFDILL